MYVFVLLSYVIACAHMFDPYICYCDTTMELLCLRQNKLIRKFEDHVKLQQDLDTLIIWAEKWV